MAHVSVIVSSFNQQSTILSTLESVRTAGIEDVEIIVCDDGSKDATRSLIDDWYVHAKSWNARIIRIFQEQNLGTCRNFRSGCLAASGDYVKMLGGDDQIIPGALKEMARRMADDKLKIAFGKPIYMIEDGSVLAAEDSYRDILRDFRDFDRMSVGEQYRALLKANRVFAPCAVIERKALLGKLSEIMPYTMLEDWPLWLAFSKSGQKIHYLEIDFIKYRIHPFNVSRQSARRFHRSAYQADILKILAMNERQMEVWRLRDFVELKVSHLKIKAGLSLERSPAIFLRSALWKILRKIIVLISRISFV